MNIIIDRHVSGESRATEAKATHPAIGLADTFVDLPDTFGSSVSEESSDLIVL